MSMSNSGSTSNNANIDVTSTVNFTNLVYNKNDISVPITINNRNELHSDFNSTSNSGVVSYFFYIFITFFVKISYVQI